MSESKTLKYLSPYASTEVRHEALTSGDYDVAVLNVGIVYQPVCVRTPVTPEAAAEVCTQHDPPGTSYNRWEFVERDQLPDSWWEGPGATEGRDTPYPQPCSDFPETHVHIVVEC